MGSQLLHVLMNDNEETVLSLNTVPVLLIAQGYGLIEGVQ
jgi:hypothetical protein